MRLFSSFAFLAALFTAVHTATVERRSKYTGHCLVPSSTALSHERAILKASKLIPVNYDDFAPSTTVNVYFNDQVAPYNASLSALQTTSAPAVYFPPPQHNHRDIDDMDTTYTLIMNDPDALDDLLGPSFLHWIRRGLKPACGDVAATDTAGAQDVRMYIPPTPPPLVQPTAHRYALTILREPKTGYDPNVLENLLKLTSFDMRTFEKETGAKVIGSTYFLGSLF